MSVKKFFSHLFGADKAQGATDVPPQMITKLAKFVETPKLSTAIPLGIDMLAKLVATKDLSTAIPLGVDMLAKLVETIDLNTAIPQGVDMLAKLLETATFGPEDPDQTGPSTSEYHYAATGRLWTVNYGAVRKVFDHNNDQPRYLWNRT